MNIQSISPRIEPLRQQENIERRIRDNRMGASLRTRKLGDTMQSMGLLSAKQVRQITKIQQQTGEPFGRIAVLKGFVKQQAVQAAIGVQFGLLRDVDHPIAIPERLTVVRKPHGPEAEQIRLMRTRLVTSCTPEDLKTIAMIGIGADTAPVELAVNLSAVFAQLHRRILIIDADLRQPGLQQFFSGNAKAGADQPGLVDYISGRARFDDIVQESMVMRMDMIMQGQRAFNPQILLSDTAFDGLLDRARKDYDIVVILSSGFGPIADGQFVWQKANSAIVVARKNKTQEDDLRQLSGILYDLDTRILGAVVAK